jgi:ATP adenylyltransferase
MDRLWAGWRSAYVAGAGEAGGRAVAAGAAAGAAGRGSLFRQILESGLPDEVTHIAWRGELTFAILNAYPYTTGHLLVMPYRQVGELEDVTGDEQAELWSTVRNAVVALKRAYRPHGINVGANLGEAAGAGVPSHVHLHVLPRWNADSNFMTSVAEVRVLPEPLDASWRKLRDAWPTAG